MTQQDETSRNDYVGNSSTTEFVYTFKILDRTHIQVVLIEDSTQIESIQVIDTDYDVSGVLEDGGGTVTFLTAPDSGFSIILGREVPFNQESEFVEGTPFPAATIETDYDKLTQIAQQLRMTQRTALKPPLLPNFKDGTLKPDLSTEIEAGDILQINSTVDGFVTNSASVIFEIDGLDSHQIIQLGNIAETTFISAAEWDFLGNMDQGVSTTDSVVFNSVNGATNLSDIADLTTDEIDQLKNIDSNVIDNASWGNVSAMDQDVDTSSSPEFAGLTIGGENVGAASVHLNQNLSSGSIVDGNLSIATTTTFSLTAGSGIIVDYSTDELDPSVTEVSWTGFIGVTLLNIGVGSFKSIAIDVNGDIVQTNDGFTNLELRDLIPIGIIAHDATDILLVIDFPRKAIGRFDALTDLITTIGTLNVSGNIFSANGANLQINKTAGETFGLSLNATSSQKFANITTDVGGVAVEMTPIFRDGSGGFTFGTASTDIDPGNFDDGTGTLNSLGNNQATNHRIAFSPNGGRVFFLYGQTEYANLTAAIDAVVDSFVVPSISNAEINVRTIISARGGASDLDDVADAVFTQLSRFDASGGQTNAIQAATLQSAYDQDPDITLGIATPIGLEVANNANVAFEIKSTLGVVRIDMDGSGNVNESGKLTLTGISNDGLESQLVVQAHTTQDPTIPIASFVDSSANEFVRILDGRTALVAFDDDAVPLNIIGAPNPTTFLFRVQDNASNDLFTVDKDGQVLVNGTELESGPGEFVVAYQEFGVLDPINVLSFDLVDFDDTQIIGYRIECRNLRQSTNGNDPGTIPLIIAFKATLQGQVNPQPANSYISTYMQFTSGPITPTLQEFGNIGPSVSMALFTKIGPSGVVDFPDFVESISGDFEILNIPEFAEDKMLYRSSASVVEDDGVTLSKHDGYGYITSVADPNTPFRTITISADSDGNSPSPAGTGFTSGSIKVIAIKKGGPAFT